MLTTADRIVAGREASGPYRSLYDLVTRTRLGRDEAEALIRAGALDELGLPRRELLWQLGLLIPPRSKIQQPSLPLPVDHDMVTLPKLSPWQGLAWDYDRLGVTGGLHPMTLVRPLLHEGLVTSLHLRGPRSPNRLPQQDMTVEMGRVVTRQRPQTASGVMFMLLEDEFGLANVVSIRRCRIASANWCAPHRSSSSGGGSTT